MDKNNVLWIGTFKGLRILYNTSNFFTEETIQTEPIVILEDGLPKELLELQFITDIIVDGSNASILWDETNDEFDFSHAINIPKLNVSDSSGTAYKALTVQSSNVNSDAGISLIGGGGSDLRLQQPYNSAGLFFYDVTKPKIICLCLGDVSAINPPKHPQLRQLNK